MQVNIIYRALRKESLAVPIMECLEEAVKMDEMNNVISSRL